MNEPIKLTLAQVIESGRKAYLEGRLSAQGPTPTCAYRDENGRPCIIGAAMSSADAVRFDARPTTTIGALISDGLVSSKATSALPELQQAHDRWADAKSAGNLGAAKDAEANLRKLLKIDAPTPVAAKAGEA